MVDVSLGCTSIVPTAARESATPDPKEKQTQTEAGSRLFPESFPVWRVVVQRVGAHGLLRGGVGGNHRATCKGSLLTCSIALISILVQLV